MLLGIQAAHAQTYTVLHNFSNGADGGSPESALTLDAAGHLYGTTLNGGAGYGTVFRMTEMHGSWILSTLYDFKGNNGNDDGAGPIAKVVIGPNGSLYGTTVAGGGGTVGSGCADFGYNGCGTVYNLQPPASVCTSTSCPWLETPLYKFVNGPGAYPFGGVAFDHAGNIYGTTQLGGIGEDGGIAYELTPSGRSWVGSVLISFTAGTGDEPYDTLVLDSAGNLYGTARGGGANGYGVVFELSPNGSGWTETILHSFDDSDGAQPFGGLIFDSAGNLYGATSCGGTGGGGTVYELSPSGGGWQFNVLYDLTGSCQFGPQDSLTMDSAGSLYGTTYQNGANDLGSVFKLTHSESGWTFTDLHDFSGGADGCEPNGGVVLDSAGNIYGTTTGCGTYPNQYGTIWEIAPE
jgi:uncharacterized repeat protein (TIGR03803 family)